MVGVSSTWPPAVSTEGFRDSDGIWDWIMEDGSEEEGDCIDGRALEAGLSALSGLLSLQ
jgi:hypothetical protein